VEKAIDPVEFRDTQRAQWDTAASGWKKWSELIDRGTSEVSERLVELAGVEPGSRVLDVAAGYGEPALSAARKAGPDGRVTATDISAEMLAFGRERAMQAGLDNIDFVESAVLSLDLPEQSFDAALSRWGIIFDPDGEGAAAHVRTMLKPGGRFAISSWGEPEQVPMLAIPIRTAMERLDVPPPPPGTPGPLSRPTPEAISGLLEGGGFSEVEVEQMDVELEYQSPEEFTTFVREIAPPVTAMIAPHPEDVQRETWEAITEAVREREGDGPITLTNRVLMAAGRA
jgi:enediyne biosynthesis protein CalE5